MKKTNGTANSEITQLLEEVAINCIHSGYDVVGLSFDEYPSNLKYVNEMCCQITEYVAHEYVLLYQMTTKHSVWKILAVLK